jgi:hypothetical protein
MGGQLFIFISHAKIAWSGRKRRAAARGRRYAMSIVMTEHISAVFRQSNREIQAS